VTLGSDVFYYTEKICEFKTV